MAGFRAPAAATLLWLACLVGLVGWFWYTRYDTPCHQTLHYAIGRFDTQFGESQADFLQAASAAEAVWEEPTGFPLFQYDPAASFKLNLIFDDRQQATNDQQQLEHEINDGSASFDSKKAAYDAERADYDRRSAALKAQIDHYNAAGGAPSDVYDQIEAERRSVNALADELNRLGEQLNAQALALNLKIDSLNTRVGRVFDQATYTGKDINLYEFKSQQDLVLALAHEFGHALTLEHVSDPKAIMYYLLQEQDPEHPALTDADLSALREACTARLVPRVLSDRLHF